MFCASRWDSEMGIDNQMRPHADPVETMRELPEETRQFLARLRPEDLRELEDTIRDRIFMKTLGKFGKWLAFGILGLAVGLVAMQDSINKIIGWFRT